MAYDDDGYLIYLLKKIYLHFMCMRKGIPQLPIIAGAQVQGKRDRSRHPCRKPMDFPMKIMGMFNELSFNNHPSGIIFYRI